MYVELKNINKTFGDYKASDSINFGNEVQKYRSSASEGVVENVAFRGDNIELHIRVNNNIIVAKRGLEEKTIAVGEKVDVFLYRVFVTANNQVHLLENQSLNDDSVVI